MEGTTITIEWRFADGQVERLPSLAAGLVNRNVELIVASTGQAALAVKNTTSTIPIIFWAVGDPVANGLVRSLARPGGNATGFTSAQTELVQKRLAILKELVPGVRKVGVLRGPTFSEVATAEELKRFDGGAKALGLELHFEEVSEPQGLDRAFVAMKHAGVGAVMPIPHPLFYTNRARLVALSTKTRLPLMGWIRDLRTVRRPRRGSAPGRS